MMRLLAVLFLVIGTCAFAPTNPMSFDPPAHYREVFDSAVACSHYYKPYSRIRWFVVPGKDFKCKSGRCIGYTQWPNTIFIADEWRGIDWVVKHEMIHYVTGMPHFDGDSALWGKACHATWGYLPNDDPNYRP